MSNRIIHLAADGETILQILFMSPEDAALQLQGSETLVALDPSTDTGTFIDNSVVKYNSTAGTIVNAVSGDPISTFDNILMDELI